MKPTNAQIRQFITTTFNDSELETFCFDYFPEVKYTRGMEFNYKVELLIGYCQRRDLEANLLTNLQQERPQPFAAQFSTKAKLPPIVEAKPRNPRQIFISHAHEDGELAQRLASDLEAEGWPVWIAPDSIQPGEKWASAISRGLDESGIFVLLLTPHAVKSRWVRHETDVAVEMEHEGGMRFIPVLVEPCKIPALWRAYQRISFQRGYDTDLVGLLTVLDGLDERLTKSSPRTSSKNSFFQEKNESEFVSTSIEDEFADLYEVLSREDAVRCAAVFSRLTDRQKDVLKAFAVGLNPQQVAEKLFISIKTVDAHKTVILAECRNMWSLSGDVFLDYRFLAEKFKLFLDFTLKDYNLGRPVTVPESGTVRRPATAVRNRSVHKKTGLRFVPVSAGEFLYGDNKEKKHLPEFWIGKTPVTNAVYKRFLDANPKQSIPFVNADWAKPYNWDEKKRTYPAGKADHPVVLVSWHDAQAFCEWAGLRLPTEEEWEKAARGTDGRKYPWGDQQPTRNLCNFGENEGGTTPVGNYSPKGDSPYGCVDMNGNVWEWTSSLYQKGEDSRVVRGGAWGGSWFNPRYNARTASRLSRPLLENRFDYVGFRVVVVRPPSESASSPISS